MLKTLPIRLIGENLLLRDHLESLLREEGFAIIPGADELPEADAIAGPELIVLDATVQPSELVARLAALRTSRPGLRIVALASRHSQASLAREVGRHLDAVLLSAHAQRVIVCALQAVAAGYHVAPAAEPAPPAGLAGPPMDGLSPREAAILDAVCRGETNKQIALALGIREATVKVHLRGIFRSIGVRNRTQAAIWLQNHRPPPLGNGAGGREALPAAG
jgi:two-component system nitrate/nitrite response regulator NarL